MAAYQENQQHYPRGSSSLFELCERRLGSFLTLPSRYQPIDFEYPYFLDQSLVRDGESELLLDRIAQGKENAVGIVVGILEGFPYQNSYGVAQASFLLGRRVGLPGSNLGLEQWEPILGRKINIKFALPFVHRVKRIIFEQRIKYSYFDVLERNMYEDLRLKLPGIKGRKFHCFTGAIQDHLLDKTHHVVAMEVDLAANRMPAVLTTDQNLELRWFKATELPIGLSSFTQAVIMTAAKNLSDHYAHFDYRNDGLVQCEEFRMRCQAPVFRAYEFWLDKVIVKLQEDDPRRRLLINQRQYIQNEIEISDISRERYNAISVDSIDAPNDVENWSLERLHECIEGWGEFTLWSNWFPEGNPFFVILPKNYPDLPKTIQIGGEPYHFLQRRFDRTWIPDIDKLTETRISYLFDKLAPLYDQDTFVDIEQKKVVISRLLKNVRAIELPVRSNLLDVAVGAGVSLGLIPDNCELTGIDLSSEMLDRAAKKAHQLGITVDLKQCSASSMPFSDESFQAVICSFGADWFGKNQKPFLEMIRVLAKGGTLSFNYHWSRYWDIMRENLFQIAKEQGLKIRVDETVIETSKGKYIERFVTIRKPL